MKTLLQTTICLLLLITGATHALAEIRLPTLISDNMILQQNKSVLLWGWAAPGEKVVVYTSWNQKQTSTTTNNDGEWQVKIKTTGAGGPYHITFSGKNMIEVRNVLLGEVWLASGQSNMNFPLEPEGSWRTGVFDYQAVIKNADYERIRMFDVKQRVAEKPEDYVQGKWVTCTPLVAGRFSAVAYYFAREIYRVKGFPVGIINASWGGTPAESWTKKEVLESDTLFQPILKRYSEALAHYPEAISSYPSALAEWALIAKADSLKGIKPPAAPKKPSDPLTDSQSPAKIYNGMIHPLVNYAIKGVIWYQGEANANRAYQYRSLFPALIGSWRDEWKDMFPFYFVQIAPHYSQNPEIREAQLLTYQHVQKTGMVVITDAADSLDIHPRNKEVVGHRLALWALAKSYKQKHIVPSGPIYRSMKIIHNQIRINFSFTSGGLIAQGGNLKEFFISGADQKFVPAKAVVNGNHIMVSSDLVKNPVAVRFAWNNVPRPNLYNAAGLPASPFRTDSWPGKTFGKN